MPKEWSWYLGQNSEVAPEVYEARGTVKKVPDATWERITKAVPVEVVGAYTAAVPFAALAPFSVGVMFAVFVVGLIVTYYAMKVLRGVNPGHSDPKLRRIARIQIGVALLAFAVWAYAQGGFFKAFTFTVGSPPDQAVYMLYHDAIAGLLAIGMGLIVIFSDKIAGTEKPA